MVPLIRDGHPGLPVGIVLHFGDVIEEIDWSVGQILNRLRETGLDRNTVVFFTSDNGPWLTFDEQGGSAGLLRGGKGGTFEGGMREPALFWGPGRIEPRVVAEMGATMDILPTFLSLAGGTRPGDRLLDGVDLTPVLRGETVSPRETVFFYRGTEIYAARLGSYKAHFITQSEYGGEPAVRHDPPLLYHLEHDPSEKYDIADRHPDVIEAIRKAVEEHLLTVEPVEDQLAIRLAGVTP